MKDVEKSKSIRAGLQKGFRNGTSKMVQRRCYGYDTDPDGELVINPNEATIVHWIFEHYLSGNSLGKIATWLEAQGILSPTGKSKWNREAINKLFSNEKYTGRVLLQKSISIGSSKFKNDGFMDRYLYTDSHEPVLYIWIGGDFIMLYLNHVFTLIQEIWWEILPRQNQQACLGWMT